MINRSHELRAAAYTALTSAQYAAVIGQIAARIGELYPDETTQADVKLAAQNVFAAASHASRAVLALSKDDMGAARTAAQGAQAAAHVVLDTTQRALSLASSALQTTPTEIPDTEGLIALWEKFRSFTPDPFTPPPSADSSSEA